MTDSPSPDPPRAPPAAPPGPPGEPPPLARPIEARLVCAGPGLTTWGVWQAIGCTVIATVMIVATGFAVGVVSGLLPAFGITLGAAALMMLIIGVSQGVVLLFVWYLSRGGDRRATLAWRPSGLSVAEYLVLFVGTWFAAAVGMGLSILASPYLPSLTRYPTGIWSALGPMQIVVWLLLISLLPGFGEELLFRGVMLRRVLPRMRPVAAILLTAALFAALHVDPGHAIFAWPLGVFFGVVAWRTGSVWPSIFCHASYNGGWNLLMIRATQDGWSDATINGVLIGMAALGVPGMIGSYWILRRCRPAEARTQRVRTGPDPHGDARDTGAPPDSAADEAGRPRESRDP